MYTRNNPITEPTEKVAKTSGPWLIVDCVCQNWTAPCPGKLSYVKVLFAGMDHNYEKLQLRDFVPLKEPMEARRLIEDHVRPHTKEKGNLMADATIHYPPPRTPKKKQEIPLEVIVELVVGAAHLEHAASILHQKGMSHTADMLHAQAKNLKALLK